MATIVINCQLLLADREYYHKTYVPRGACFAQATALADFATGDRGGDVISLAAFLFDLPQGQAASRIALMIGLSKGTN